ncbi:MAG: hypothetical protein IJ740_07775 [Ruminococcus sp.]|nr:hypothetical protein [Ruminococcus sp.]
MTDIVSAVGAMQTSPAAYAPERIKVKMSAADAKESAKTGRADTLILSEEAKKALDKLSTQVDKQNTAAFSTYNMKQQLESSKATAKAQADAAEDEMKMLEIARRLQHGDKVPMQDERALLEYDDKLYQVSKQIGMMKQNEKRKEYDSLLEEHEPYEMQQIDEPEYREIEISGSEGVEVTPADITDVPIS